jgi:NAD(P)-dependent dehydrogenase (short-subunit alcohol dehydrogenase family)
MAGHMDGKVVLITGASAGIGRATALQFAEAGAQVVVADIAVEGGEETVRLLEEAGGAGHFMKVDVTQSAEVEELVNQTVERYGRLDYAVNNAGIEGAVALTPDYSEEMWNRVLAINLTGVWLGMKYQIPQMLRQGGGAIVNTASILGLVAAPTFCAYNASKHGVVGLTKTTALEYAEKGIRVNAVCPGFIETPMVMERGVRAGEDEEVYRSIEQLHPMKRLGQAEEIAEAIVWLCSDAASFVTGVALNVDGGYVAQ